MPTMALEIALAATPQCQSGTPASRRIRSGLLDGQVASGVTIQSLTKAVNHNSSSDRASQINQEEEINPRGLNGPMGKPKCLSGTSETGRRITLRLAEEQPCPIGPTIPSEGH